MIDKSDLVFIDAPLSGFSRAVGKGTAKDFAGTDEDIHAFEKFIVRYITVNERWNSPKFLFGESYGTTRSAGWWRHFRETASSSTASHCSLPS